MSVPSLLVGVLVSLAASVHASEPLVLVDPKPGLPMASVQAKESRLALTKDGMLRVEIGAAKFWPGVTISGPQSGWDLSRHGRLEMEVRNPGAEMIAVSLRVDTFSDGSEVTWQTRSVRVEGGGTATLQMDLARRGEGKLGGKLFGMRGYPASAKGDLKADPARVSRLLVFLPKGTSGTSFEMGRVTAVGPVVPPTASVDDAEPYFPFVDRFGQYRHRDWKGKVKSVEE